MLAQLNQCLWETIYLHGKILVCQTCCYFGQCFTSCT